MSKIYIGTSGWMYKHWGEIFYPKEVKGTNQLPFYAKTFNCVEINSTFYRIPKKIFAENWAKTTPASFSFAVKMNNYMTHTKRLILDEKSQQKLEIYYKVVSALGDKLKVLLVQLPPSSKANLERLAAFLKELKDKFGKIDIACEFRHESWFKQETYNLLKAQSAGLVIGTKPGEYKAPYVLTADFIYVRFHPSQKALFFQNKELDKWAEYLKNCQKDLKSVYAFFNDDAYGYAVDNARYLMDRMGLK